MMHCETSVYQMYQMKEYQVRGFPYEVFFPSELAARFLLRLLSTHLGQRYYVRYFAHRRQGDEIIRGAIPSYASTGTPNEMYSVKSKSNSTMTSVGHGRILLGNHTVIYSVTILYYPVKPTYPYAEPCCILPHSE